MRPGWGPWLLLGSIIAIGGALRLWNLEAAQYRADDDVIRTLALDLVRKGELPTGVPSSIGIANGPTAPLLLAVAAWFSPDHLPLSIYVALLNTAAIPVAYVLGRDMFGPRAGLVAAALVATNPWLVAYGRRLWLNAFIGPAALALIWLIYRAASQGPVVRWLLAGGAASLSAQIHLSCIPNLAAFASTLLWTSGATRRGAALGMGASLLLMVPWLGLSLWPDLTHFDWEGARSQAAELGSNSFERTTIVMTGVAYQSLTGQAARILDATAPPFSWLDVATRVLAGAGWAFICWLAWRERHRRPSLAATSLVMALMVAIPTLALLRPTQTGQLPYLYPYYFINVIPPLILGVAGLAEMLSRFVRHLGTGIVTVIAGAHLVLAIPYFLTQDEFWPLGGYGVPWNQTAAFVEQVEAMARAERSPILVGGHEDDNEQSVVIARLLRQGNDVVRLHDSRDGIVFRTGSAPNVLVTTNDEHPMTQVLRAGFGHRQAVEQVLPGAGWTRRAFKVSASELEQWAAQRLPAVADSPADRGLVAYERVALTRTGELLDDPTIAILWRLEGDPPEPFFTDIVVSESGREILRETHVAYPAASWQPGDWLETRMLNLFRLPAATRVTDAMTVRFEHRGIVTGRPVSPVVQVGPGSHMPVSRPRVAPQ